MLEKAESEPLEGLGAGRFRTAKRLRKLQPGVFNRLSGPPSVVRGMEWTAVLLACLKDVPTVVAMRWWSREQARGANGCCTSLIVAMPAAPGWGCCHCRGRLCDPLAKRPSGLGCARPRTHGLATHPRPASPRASQGLGGPFAPEAVDRHHWWAFSSSRLGRPGVAGGRSSRRGRRTLVAGHQSSDFLA